MAQSEPLPTPNPNVGHPLLRSILLELARWGLPLFEAFVASWLTSKGITLPPVGVPNEKPPASPVPPVPPVPVVGDPFTGPPVQTP